MHMRHSAVSRGIVEGARWIIAGLACFVLALAYAATWLIDLAWLSLRTLGNIALGVPQPADDLAIYVRRVIVKDIREVAHLLF